MLFQIADDSCAFPYVSVVVTLPHPEEEEHMNNEVGVDETKSQSIEPDGNESHILPQSLPGQSYMNTLRMPMMIPIQSNSNRSDMMPQMVASQIRTPYYSQPILNSYPFPSGSSLTFGNDISNGAGSISLAPVNPMQTMGQVRFTCFFSEIEYLHLHGELRQPRYPHPRDGPGQRTPTPPASA